MGLITNLVLCSLVFLICSSDIRGQNVTVPQISDPALNSSEPLTTATNYISTVPVSSDSAQPNATLSTPLLPSPTANSSSSSGDSGSINISSNSSSSSGNTGSINVSSSNSSDSTSSISTVSASPVSTPQTTPQDNKALPNGTATELPVTTGGVSSSAPENSTVIEEPTPSPGASSQLTTKSPDIDSPLPVSTTPAATVARSDPSPTTTPPSEGPVRTTTASSPKTTSTTPAKTHQETPSELNVGDDDVPSTSHKSGAPLDPLLASLVSVFIVSAAIVTLLLFLKYRRRNEGPEFRRLQDLPMDDMMEDTPLSMFTY